MSPKVNIIIPVFNRLCYLNDTVSSVQAQTFASWTLLIVDDGSTEDVKGWLQCQNDPRIFYLRQENQGNAVARNTGVRYSESQYVICLDSDDTWHPTMLQRCVDLLDQDISLDLVHAGATAIDSDGQPLARPVKPDCPGGELVKALLEGYPLLPSCTLLRRSSFETFGGYTPGLDDWEMWLRWAGFGCRAGCINEPLVYYRIHDQNLNLNWDQRRDVHFRTLDKFFKRSHLSSSSSLVCRAYAIQHRHFSILAWQLNKPSEALEEFRRAVKLFPKSIEEQGIYERLACAHQQWRDVGTSEGFSMKTAQATLLQTLNALSVPDEIVTSSARNRAYARAYLALGRIACGVLRDGPTTRSYLAQALRSYPLIFFSTDWLVWWIRSQDIYKALRAIKNRR